jgi:hypothetical protein
MTLCSCSAVIKAHATFVHRFKLSVLKSSLGLPARTIRRDDEPKVCTPSVPIKNLEHKALTKRMTVPRTLLNSSMPKAPSVDQLLGRCVRHPRIQRSRRRRRFRSRAALQRETQHLLCAPHAESDSSKLSKTGMFNLLAAEEPAIESSDDAEAVEAATQHFRDCSCDLLMFLWRCQKGRAEKTSLLEPNADDETDAECIQVLKKLSLENLGKRPTTERNPNQQSDHYELGEDASPNNQSEAKSSPPPRDGSSDSSPNQ